MVRKQWELVVQPISTAGRNLHDREGSTVCVPKGGSFAPISLKKSACKSFGRSEPEQPKSAGPVSGGPRRGRCLQLGELPEVLGGGGEVELVAGAAGATEPKPIEA